MKRSVVQTIGNVNVGNHANATIGIHLSGNGFTVQEKCLQALAFQQMYRREDITLRAKDTCDWVFEHPEHHAWREKGGLLFLKGQAGSGKSTLMNELLDRAAPATNGHVLSFFFHKRGDKLQSSVIGMYRSLLHQILTRSPKLLEQFCVDTKFEERCRREGEVGGKWYWSESVLKEQLEKVLHKHSNDFNLQLFVDAIDESGDADKANHLMRWFDSLRAKHSSMSLCVSCRPYPDVVWSPDHIIVVENGNMDDIARFVHVELSVAENFKDRPQVPAELIKRANGVFQWVVLMTPRVLECRDESLEHILKIIAQSPRELDAFYDEILGQLHPDELDLAFQYFSWITFSVDSMTVEELRHAVAVGPDQILHSYSQSKYWRDSDEGAMKLIGRLSRGLIVFQTFQPEHRDQDGRLQDKTALTVVGEEDDTAQEGDSLLLVQFNHESVRDYMRTKGMRDLLAKVRPNETFTPGYFDILLMKACLRCLMAANWPPPGWADIGDNTKIASRLEKENGFFTYACNSWVDHAWLAESDAYSTDAVIEISQWPSNHVLALWYARDCEMPFDEKVTLQHVAATYGLLSVLKSLERLDSRQLFKLKWNPAAFNVLDRFGHSAINKAAIRPQPQALEFLLQTDKFDIDRKDIYGNDLFAQAVSQGFHSIVEILLRQAKVNVNEKFSQPLDKVPDAESKKLKQKPQTALHYAAEWDDEEMMRLLLSAPKVKINATSDSNITPLIVAVLNQSTGALKILINDSRIELNLADGFGFTALHYAAESHWKEGVMLLLQTGKVKLNVRYWPGTSRRIKTPLRLLEDINCYLDIKKNCPPSLSAEQEATVKDVEKFFQQSYPELLNQPWAKLHEDYSDIKKLLTAETEDVQSQLIEQMTLEMEQKLALNQAS